MKIQKTKDYGKFVLHPLNRRVDSFKNLEESMRMHGWIPAHPMHCARADNGKIVIKDGHHRFEVARRLSIPVLYCVCDDLATIQQLDGATQKWSVANYLQSYVNAGYSDYIYVKNFHERTGITLGCCISLLANGSAKATSSIAKFKAGRFEIRDIAHANAVASITKRCINVGVDYATNNYFVQALSKCLWVKEFRADEFKQKVKRFSFLFEKQRSVADYIDLIEKVYNRNRKDKLPLAFLANEEGRRRSCIKK